MPATAGGKPASAYQIFDPVNPDTVVTPNFAAARAVSLHALGGALPHALRVAVAPDLGRQDALVAGVDREVAHALPDQVVADHVALQAVAVEQLALGGHVAVVGERLVDLEVIAPAGQLQAVEPPGGRLGGQLLQRQVGPLAGEQGYLSCHCFIASSLVHF